MKIAGYPAARFDFAHAGVALSIFRVEALEALVDRDALLREERIAEPPYWAHLWVGAIALARRLAEGGDLSGRRVLDLGCGLGLTGLVAAARRAEVWFLDREPAALEFVRASAAVCGFDRCHALAIDFTAPAAELEGLRFDLILGAEIVYDAAAYQPLAGFLDRHLADDGVALLTDAFRSDAVRFFAELERLGFAGEREPRREWEEGRWQGLFLWSFLRTAGFSRSG